MTQKRKTGHIKLTSHPGEHAVFCPIHWGAASPEARGPVIATLTEPRHRNVIGTHSGSYAVYRALAVAAGALAPLHKADLTNTSPAAELGPHPAWCDAERIVSLDPWGASISSVFSALLADGVDIRPTIAVTKAHIQMPEITDAVEAGRLRLDGKVLRRGGDVVVTKAALEPVWYLPGIAARFGLPVHDLRRALFEQTAGMFPELITRPDLDVFLPPIGGTTVYLFGDVTTLGRPETTVAARVHDECNGSDICTCRPYLAHGIEVCIQTAQEGGVGVIVYCRKEGRALGEVTKFLVYNARKRQEGGDRADAYFQRTECVAGVQDMRFQELMPDVLHWLGVQTIHRFVSMSDMKYNALAKAGIRIEERVPIPDELVPPDARVEIEAKKAAGYFSGAAPPSAPELAEVKGRDLDA